MSFYAETAVIADEVLRDFGATGTLTRTESTGVYDPETGDYSTSVTVQDVVAVVLPIDARLIDGQSVLATDETAYLSAVGVTAPQASDSLTWGGKTYTVMRCKNLAPAGQAVLYELQVRAA